jgi:hypothetical protein
LEKVKIFTEEFVSGFYTATCKLCGKENNNAYGGACLRALELDTNDLVTENHLSCRMFNPQGDIFKVQHERIKNTERHAEYFSIVDGDDTFLIPKE